MLSFEQEINDKRIHTDNNFFTYRLLFPCCMMSVMRGSGVDSGVGSGVDSGVDSGVEDSPGSVKNRLLQLLA